MLYHDEDLVEDFFLAGGFHATVETQLPHQVIELEDAMQVEDDHIVPLSSAYTKDKLIEKYGMDPGGYSQRPW